MNKILTALAGSMLLSITAWAQSAAPAIPRDDAMEQRIEQLIKKLTLEEKIGQMTQLTLDVLGKPLDPASPDPGRFVFDQAKLDTVIGKYKVGSILNVPGIAVTPEEWYEIISRIQEVSMKEIGVPCIYGLDMNHGASYTLGATMLPQNLNMAATFNRDLAHRGGEITAYETRASNTPWTFNPTVDLGRDPRWPRIWENYGEDAYLSAQMGSATVQGMQGSDPNKVDNNHIAANLKHFMGYGVPVSGKDRTHSSISDQEMREKHFAPYLEAIANGHALSIMVNSTTNNGIPFHANAKYLTRWLKDELNWDGLIVTDWADINNLWWREYVATDKKDAIRIAINAGIDMAMEPYAWDFCTLLKELVEEGEVPMSRIDDACARVLRLKMRLGLFEHPNTIYSDYPLFGSKQFAADALRAAEESMVLLKNEGNILPLKKGTRILVTGPNADTMRGLNGGWTYTWQGQFTDRFAKDYNTILEAMTQRFGKDNIVYEPGVTYGEYQWGGNFNHENTPDIDAAVRAAANVDVIVACVGESSYCETPGNIDDLNLSPAQTELVKALATTGKPIVLVLNEGRPRLINSIEPLARAVIDIMLPGNYGGDALAMLLAGDANFSGRMPITYPRHSAGLITYDFKKGESTQTMSGAYNYDATVDVQWPFGHGLSYTTFKYDNLRVNKPEFTDDDTLTFTVDVTNTGNRAGKESVLLYSSDLVASTSPDVRRLRQFDKIELQPGETKTVTLTIPASDLAFVGYDDRWRLEKGDFRIQVGDLVIPIKATATKVWDTPNR